MQTLDLTFGKRPTIDQEFKLTVVFHNKEEFVFYGDTKKEAIKNFKKSFGTFRGFISKKWELDPK